MNEISNGDHETKLGQIIEFVKEASNLRDLLIQIRNVIQDNADK